MSPNRRLQQTHVPEANELIAFKGVGGVRDRRFRESLGDGSGFGNLGVCPLGY